MSDAKTPFSLEAEQAVIGGILLDNSALESLSLVADDFYRADHRIIYTEILRLYNSKKPIDVITLSDNKEIELSYIGELHRDTGSVANIQTYAEVVKDKSVLRGLLSTVNEISQQIYSNSLPASELLDIAEGKILSISEKRETRGVRRASELLQEALSKIDQWGRSGGVTGLPTGFTELDRMILGLQPSELIIVAGRPSMGKTAFALNIAEQATQPVLVFSMEMDSNSLINRMMSSQSGVGLTNIRTGNLSQDHWNKINPVLHQIQNQELYIDDTPALTPTDIRSRSRRLHREVGLGLIVVDYLQLMTVHGKENRVVEVSEISRQLKALAKELKCPVLALSQLNRSLEQRPNKRPLMSDLRDSGTIEQDADLILFIYRDEVYNQNSLDKGIAEVMISKNRNGEIGTCMLKFHGKNTKFTN